jgi:hypothetical protein
MKNKKAMSIGQGMVIFLILSILLGGIYFVISGKFIGTSIGTTTKMERKTAMESCAAISSRPNLPGFGDNQQKLNIPRYNRDGDYHLDECDICLGVGGQKEDGHNKNDRDNDYIPDDCDLNPDKEDTKMNCVRYVHELNSEGDPEFTGQCGTISYCDVFLEETREESGIGTKILVCENEIKK